MKTVLFIQHGEVDKPGLLAEVLGEIGIMLRIAHIYSCDIPSLDAEDFDGLVLGGGGQSAYEVELYDGSGATTVIWLGRRSIPGIFAGRRMRVNGRMTFVDGHKTIYNPRYILKPMKS